MNKIFSTALAAGIAVSAFANGAVENPYQPPRKKLIDMSWSNPSITYLTANLERMEKEAPIDGITLRLEGEKVENGKKIKVYSHNTITKDKFKYEYFAKDIAALKKLKFKRFTDNFLYTTMTPAKNMDWFDDAYWDSICSNYALLARISREAKLTGIVFDSEEYGGRIWGNYKGSDRAKAVTKARQRGQEWGKAVFKENPEVKILCLFFFSHGTFIMGDAEASTLIHSFYNGVLDVMPPTATIIDGHEYFGYFGKNRNCFVQLRYDVDHTFLARVSANNYKKYRNQVQLAAPLYIDALTGVNASFNRYLVPEIANQPKVDFIRQVLWNAMDVSDEYVWFYSERGCWWDKSTHPKVKGSWEKQVPGINAALQELSAISALDLNKAKNLLIIPQLNKDPATKEPGKWNFWCQNNKDPKKQSGWKDGKVYITGPQTNSCANQLVEVKPGKTYLFKVEARPRSPKNSSLVYMGVAFRNAAGKFLPLRRELRIKPLEFGNWESMVFLITAPADAKFASYQLGVRGLLADQVVEFQRPQLLELP